MLPVPTKSVIIRASLKGLAVAAYSLCSVAHRVNDDTWKLHHTSHVVAPELPMCLIYSGRRSCELIPYGMVWPRQLHDRRKELLPG